MLPEFYNYHFLPFLRKQESKREMFPTFIKGTGFPQEFTPYLIRGENDNLNCPPFSSFDPACR
jgi:hypothetical protein